MFEKEAEEYANKFWGRKESLDRTCTIDNFKDGAEFGYNKANEWHYVKDGDLPKNNNDGTTYLLYTIYGRGGSPVVARFKERDSQLLMNIWTGAILTEDKVITWKEFVFPEQ